MPKKYILRKNYLSVDRVQSLMKTLLEKVKHDRLAAEKLFEDCRERLNNAGAIEEFTALISSAATALSQMQNTNKKIIEVMMVIHKFGSGGTKDAAGIEAPGTLLFNELSKKLSIKDKEPNEEN